MSHPYTNGTPPAGGPADPRAIRLGAEVERIARRQDLLEERLLQLAAICAQ